MARRQKKRRLDWRLLGSELEMENRLAEMMRVSRTIGVMLLLVAITGFIAREGFLREGLDIYALFLFCIASVGATCLTYAYHIRQLLRVQTGREPKTY